MFQEASQLTALGGGRFAGTVDDTWTQGRGVYGGMVAALLTRALVAMVDAPDRHLRTLTVQFVAPATPGPMTVEVEIVRAGSNATFASARLTCATGVCATALGTFARDRRDGPTALYDDRPDFPAFDTLPEPPTMLGVPRFSQHVDYRWLLGSIYSGATHGEVGGWCRMRGDATPDVVMIAALLDVWAPPALMLLDAPRPAATVDLTYHFLAPLPLEGAHARDPYAVRSVCTWAKDGYAETVGSLWSADGRLVARQRQLVAML
jgi:acyl-CoA thioesterase